MADGLYGFALTNYNNAGCTAIMNPGAWISLHATNPVSAGGNELTASGYARQPVSTAATGSGVNYNSSALIFGPAREEWTIQYYGLWTAVSAGTCLGHWIIRNSFGTGIVATTVSIADGVFFAEGDLTFTLTDA